MCGCVLHGWPWQLFPHCVSLTLPRHAPAPRHVLLQRCVCCCHHHHHHHHHPVQRANDELRDWVIPVKRDTDPFMDPFEERATLKKERIVKNKLSHIRNLVSVLWCRCRCRCSVVVQWCCGGAVW